MGLLINVTERDAALFPPGPVYQCQVCGTRMRSGQPHCALEPEPHQTFEAIIIEERL